MFVLLGLCSPLVGLLFRAMNLNVGKNIFLLALCQALHLTGTSAVLTVTALAGDMLAEAKSLATLPMALQFVAIMVTTIPASHFMQRFGRRPGFIIGAVIGIGGGALSAYALFLGSFALLCAGAVLLGVLMGFAMFYRFAAAEVAAPQFRNVAISLVLAGGVVAAFTGPNLAKYTKDFFDTATFAGSYGALVLLHIATIILLLFIDLPKPRPSAGHDTARPLKEISRQPEFIVAVIGAMAAYGAMNLVMTATPLAMTAHRYPFSDTTFVIQWHVFAMYAPSFFTGHLINRFGVLNVMGVGGLLVLAAAGVNLGGTGLVDFASGLVLLGLGWNFLFIGATSLVTAVHRPGEKGKVQGFNDFLVFGTVAMTSLLSGAVHNNLGWQAVNYGILPFVAMALVAVLWLRLRRPAPGFGV